MKICKAEITLVFTAAWSLAGWHGFVRTFEMTGVILHLAKYEYITLIYHLC